MKKILTGISIALLISACQTSDKGSLEIKKESIPLDTTSLYKNSANADTAKITQQSISTQQKTVTTTTTQPPVQQAPQVIYKTRTIVHNNTRYIPDPNTTQNRQATNNPPVITNPIPSTVPSNSGNIGNNPSSGAGNTTASGQGNTIPNNGGIIPAKPVTPKDKGWSDAAKDATIGGVGGAIGGAVISRNKGKGALLGGIIGAAGGYILGRKKDKANNRDSSIR